MWAILGEDQRTVVGVLMPTATDEEVAAAADKSTLIRMTITNSPAWVHGTWDGEQFHPPVGTEL